MPASPTERFQLIRGEGRGSGKCRAALRALAKLPAGSSVRVVTAWATCSVVTVRLHLDASATTEPVAQPPRPAPRLGRDPLADFIRRRNDWRRS